MKIFYKVNLKKMMKSSIKFLTSAILIFAVGVLPIFADYKISQKMIIDSVAIENTIYSKGVRERRESKIISEGMSAEEAAMMENMMPANPTLITQCDLRQNVFVSESKKAYFIDYYDWTALPPDVLKRRPNRKMVVKGTSTTSSVVTDSGKQRQMFGLTAKWLKAVQTLENSADSCDGLTSLRVEREGWFADLTLEAQTCQVPITSENGGCRPKFILKAMQNPGFFLEGTIKTFENNKLQSTTKIETTALSKATLDQSLFEIPKNYAEVDAMRELIGPTFKTDNMAKTVFGDANGKFDKNVKTVAIDFFSGSVSKINQDELRSYLSSRLATAGFSGYAVNSQSEIAAGNFANVIGIEIKKAKESGASKIGGLFGKVTGNDDAAKLGESEAEIVITIYGKDGKTVVASANASEKVKGKADDAVKSAIDKILSGLLSRIK